MTARIETIIGRLERQKQAIEQALMALRDVTGTETAAFGARATRKAGTAEESRNRRSEGQKKRWAAKKAAEGAPSKQQTALAKGVLKRGAMTPEGRERLAENMRKRWALKRSAAKKSATKKRAAKKG